MSAENEAAITPNLDWAMETGRVVETATGYLCYDDGGDVTDLGADPVEVEREIRCGLCKYWPSLMDDLQGGNGR